MDCFELFSTKMGTMIDFRWVRWELKPGKLNETGMTEQAQGGQSTEGLTHISSSNYESIKKKQNGVQGQFGISLHFDIFFLGTLSLY